MQHSDASSCYDIVGQCFGRCAIVRVFFYVSRTLLQHIAWSDIICFSKNITLLANTWIHIATRMLVVIRYMEPARAVYIWYQMYTIRVDAQCFRVLPGVATNGNRMRTHGTTRIVQNKATANCLKATNRIWKFVKDLKVLPFTYMFYTRYVFIAIL